MYPAGFEFDMWKIAGPVSAGFGGSGHQRSTIMSTPTTSQGSSISQHLRATRNVLQCAVFGAKYVWSHLFRPVGGLKIELTGPQ